MIYGRYWDFVGSNNRASGQVLKLSSGVWKRLRRCHGCILTRPELWRQTLVSSQMPRRAALVCLFCSTEGLMLTFSLLCGIAGPATTHSSDRPLIQPPPIQPPPIQLPPIQSPPIQSPPIQPQGLVRQTTKADSRTSPVGEKKGQGTESDSRAKKKKGCSCVIV